MGYLSSIIWKKESDISGIYCIVTCLTELYDPSAFSQTWWRHQMETFSASLALCAGNSPVNSPHKGRWRGALMFSLICTLNKRLSKQSWGWWFEMPSRSLWRRCNELHQHRPISDRDLYSSEVLLSYLAESRSRDKIVWVFLNLLTPIRKLFIFPPFRITHSKQHLVITLDIQHDFRLHNLKGKYDDRLCFLARWGLLSTNIKSYH